MKALVPLIILLLAGCVSKPFEITPTIYNHELTTESPGLTKVRVHRVEQLSGSALGDDCPLVLKVDEKEIAGLQQNQYIDVYVPNGNHSLSVRFKCALTSWKKSLNVNADGTYQEYKTETGAAGQYRMWRVK
ncbi:hypothetical protein ACSFCT_03365 [Yokenella regensburgei]|jgi:hypothetical protein|uniref:hypothetical protein n=1 Tax=Yokenella regensburgei TaxID=158877 RepID=UPI003ED9238C